MKQFRAWFVALLLVGGFAIAPSVSATNQADQEIIATLAAFHAASTNGDIEAMKRLTLGGPKTLAIGTSPDEKFVGYDAVIGWWQGLFDFLGSVGYPNGGLPVTPAATPLQVGHSGSVGWIAAEATWNFANGDTPFRISLVLRKEHGRWKILQQHFSVGISNEDLPL
ncbi:hypothetical protein EWI61_03145 [Methylolobus aquaticus]|nr:hypothetical protein EWI61_03145 [Methylolobus aquaticus]